MNEHDVFRLTIVITLILTVLSSLWESSIAIGFLFGGLMAALVFKALSLDITRILKSGDSNVSRAVWKGYLRRYFLNGATLAVAIFNPYIQFFAVLIGLLIPKFIIVVVYIARRRNSAT